MKYFIHSHIHLHADVQTHIQTYAYPIMHACTHTHTHIPHYVENAYPYSLSHAFDVIAHFFIITYILCHGIIWWYILSYLAMVKNNFMSADLDPIRIILEEDQATILV